MREDIRAWVRLNMVTLLSPSKIIKLIKDFGSPENVLGASQKDISSSLGIRDEVSANIMREIEKVRVDEEMEKAEESGVKIITIQDPSYPTHLKKIHDPPILLYLKGEIGDGFFLSIVGSRRATPYGMITSKGLAGELAGFGVTIVSGMARGIDTSAHLGALEAGGRTIGVLGSGIDIIYPKENRSLARRISSQGALLSEFPFGTMPLRKNFPRRNRIIAGLSLGLIVVEAQKRSGALISANLALEYGREVFAVPGRIDSKESEGTNALIQDGAKMVRSAIDVLEEFPGYFKMENLSPKKPSTEPMREDEEKVYRLLGKEPMEIDLIATRLNLSIPEILTILMGLEIKGLVKQLRGKRFIKGN